MGSALSCVDRRDDLIDSASLEGVLQRDSLPGNGIQESRQTNSMIHGRIVREPTPQFRANAAICVFDPSNQKVLGFQRIDHPSWQFPQGGINPGEDPQEAALRELYEETGIGRDAVEVVSELKGWVHYEWPAKKQEQKRLMGSQNWRGQRQKWFVMKAKSLALVESLINLTGLGGAPQEFQQYGWFHLEDMLPLCRGFKRGVYAYVIRELQPIIQQASSASSQAVPGMISATQVLAEQVPPEDGTSTDPAVRSSYPEPHVPSNVNMLKQALERSTLDEAVRALVAEFGLLKVQDAVSAVAAAVQMPPTGVAASSNPLEMPLQQSTSSESQEEAPDNKNEE